MSLLALRAFGFFGMSDEKINYRKGPLRKKEKVLRKKVELTFPERLIKEPIIYQVGKKFQVVTNIFKADVNESKGWVVLELDGEQEEIDKSIQYLKALGIEVKELEG